jgi:predicted DNA-binding protein with PD1-like motif
MNRRPPIVHPGPPAPQRHALAWARAVPLDFTLPRGEAVETGLAKAVAAAGCDGACVEIDGGRFDPFRYVLPAASPDAGHAAWYSATVVPEGGVVIDRATAIVGRRDGAGFVHCHGLWRGEDDAPALGHMLPPESFPAEDVRVRGVGLSGAVFESRHDPETNFRLFAAEPSGGRVADNGSALAVTLRPNQDISYALEAICGEAGIHRASIHGIGSLNGARFESGPAMHSYASEFFVTEGRLAATPAGPRARLDIAVVDMDGAIYRGRLVRGENPICVTAELVVVARPARAMA